jgi:hypothetical protein
MFILSFLTFVNTENDQKIEDEKQKMGYFTTTLVVSF